MSSEALTKDIAIIGMGNCGSQVANLAEKKYPTLIDSIYINTSKSDLSQVEGRLQFKIGEEDEVEGSGRNRTKMKEYLREELKTILTKEEFTDVIVEKKYVFIVASTAGGTGSGGAPSFLHVLRGCYPDVNFILVAVLPQLGASLMELGNTLEFLEELYDNLGDNTTYMIYDNETTSEMSPTESLETVNAAIVEDIRIISRIDNYSTPYDSIDNADMESIVSTPGRLLITRIKGTITEKVMEDVVFDEMVIKAIKKSCHAETDRNKRVVRWGIITHFTEEVNRLYKTSFEKLIDFIGTPIERFNHHSINTKDEAMNFFYLIASGLSPINDRVKKISQRVDALKKALANDDTKKYILSGTDSSYDASEQRRKEERRSNVNEKINPLELFDSFGKK